MKTLTYLFILTISFTHTAFAQFDLKSLSKELSSKVNDASDKNQDELEDSRFNMAVSLSDNAALFENDDKYKKKLAVVGYLYKQTDIDASKDPLDQAVAMNNTGEILFAGNKYSLAESSFKSAKATYEKNGAQNSIGYATVLSNIGQLHHAMGRYTLADSTTNLALKLRKQISGEKSTQYAASLNNLAVLYDDQGLFTESENFINQSLTIFGETAGKESISYAIALNNKAMLYQSLGRYDQAEDLMNQALNTAKKSIKDNSSNYLRLQVNLAILYKEMGKYAEAEAIYQKCIDTKKKKFGTKHPDYAQMLNGLAMVYVTQKKYTEAEKLFKDASSIYKSKFGVKHPAYATSIDNLGNLYRIQGKNNEAKPLLAEAMNTRKEVLGTTHPEYLNSVENFGLLQWQMGNFTEASQMLTSTLDAELVLIQNHFPSMSENEKGKFWDKVRPKFERFNSFAIASQEQDATLISKMYNYHISTKGILLNATNKVKSQILSGKDVELKKAYLTWLDQKENLAQLYSYSKEELQEQKINLDSLENVANQLEKELSKKSDAFSEGYKMGLVDFKQIQTKLKSTEAAVEIIQFHKFDKTLLDSTYYVALVLTQNKAIPQVIVIKNGIELESKYYKYYKNCITNKQEDQYTYSKFWQAIDATLSGQKLIYVSLDGIYNQLSINTFKDTEGKYLLDKYTITIVGNTNYIVSKKTVAANTNKKTTLLGNPNYGNGGTVAQLPGTAIEIKNIQTLLTTNGYQTKVFTQLQASEKNIKAEKNPKILHIATHGFFQKDVSNTNSMVFGTEGSKAIENPLLRSGLLLAGADNNQEESKEASDNDNGVLTAYEAMNLQLDQTELVVLSACETGLGDIKNGEGVYGLQRAFQVAGAKSMIMSLWKVNDAATQELMSKFYTYWLKTGQKQSSFTKAQKELKLKYPEPYYWGAFVLIGE